MKFLATLTICKSFSFPSSRSVGHLKLVKVKIRLKLSLRKRKNPQKGYLTLKLLFKKLNIKFSIFWLKVKVEMPRKNLIFHLKMTQISHFHFVLSCWCLLTRFYISWRLNLLLKIGNNILTYSKNTIFHQENMLTQVQKSSLRCTSFSNPVGKMKIWNEPQVLSSKKGFSLNFQTCLVMFFSYPNHNKGNLKLMI